MWNLFINYCFLIGASSVVLAETELEPNYYWRDYSGIIPEDALVGASVGAERPDGENIYIGQAAVKDAGLLVVEIHPEENQVWIPHYGVKKQRVGIKILCSPEKDTFKWKATNSTNFKDVLKNKTVIVGGLEDTTILYVARTVYGGEPHVGKVGQFEETPGKALIYVVDGENEQAVDIYDVLTYEKNCRSVKKLEKTCVCALFTDSPGILAV